MNNVLQPLQAVSLKDNFVQQFQQLILSGQLDVGHKLPSERALAQQLRVSRPVVHDGLTELAARGLITMTPRRGARVNDYRRQGSLALLTSILDYRDGELDPDLLHGLLDMRRLLEVETARCAADNRSTDDLLELRRLYELELAATTDDADEIARFDFDLHHAVALASRNPIYAMLFKSCEPAHRSLAARFFGEPGAVDAVRSFHDQLIDAIADRDAERAAAVMAEILDHGRVVLEGLLERQSERT